MTPYVSKDPRTGKWRVRWDEYIIIDDADGTPQQKRLERTVSLRTEGLARERARAIESAHARGEVFTTASERPTTTLGRIGAAYLAAAASAGAPLATQRFRFSLVKAFLKFARMDTPASDLSIGLLTRYADSLPGDGRKAATRHRKVLGVEQMWRWAENRPEEFPGVPRPRKLTGTDADQISAPVPVVARGRVDWPDLDRMIAHLDQREWHRRLAMLLRYHGLRVGQALGLTWRDIDLEERVLYLRAGVEGAKRGCARSVPMNSTLVAEMANWGPREGHVFKRPDGRPWRADAAVEPFRRAWERSGVERAKWDAEDEGVRQSGDRAKARPSHAFRACVRTGLVRLGVDEAAVLHYVGHSAGRTASAYVPESEPTSSPHWPSLVNAVEKIPPFIEIKDQEQVISLRRRA